MNTADIADQVIQESLDKALAKQREKAAAQQESRDDPYCEGCGTLIPVKRRKCLPGCKYCVSCQASEESRQQHYWH